MILVAELRSLTTDEAARKLRGDMSEAAAEACGHVPERVVLVSAGSLPRTTSGKLRRAEIARLYETGMLGARREHPQQADAAPPAKLYKERLPVSSIDVTEPSFALNSLLRLSASA